MRTPTKKSYTAFAVALTGAIALTACSTEGNGNSGNSSEGADSGTLSIFWKGSEKAGIDAAVEEYQKLHPDLKIDVTTADVEQYQATIRTQLSAGTAADVIFVWPARGNPATIAEIAPGGFIEDLSEREWAADLPDTIRDLYSIDDKLYLIGPSVSSWGPWYNQTVLDEEDLTPPRTWPEVIPFCEAAQDAGHVAYAIGAATLNANQNILFGLVPDLVYGTNPDFGEQIRSGETTFSDEPGWVEAMDKFSQMNDAGCFNPDPTGANQEEQNRLVATGEALAYFGIATQLAGMQEMAPDVEFKMHPFSGADSEADANLIIASNAGGAAVNTEATNKDGAFEFVDWLASPAGLAAYNDAVVGTIPAIPTGEEYTDANLATTNEFLSKGATVPFLDQDWPNPRIQQAMFSGVQGILAGTQSPSEVLEAMDSELE